jgi:hypothetical protein
LDKVAQPFDYIVERALKEHTEMLAYSITRGQAVDYTDYKYICGQICGIQFAMDVLRDARKRVSVDGDLE